MKKYKCGICEDTGFKDFASFCMDSCDHDTNHPILQSALDTQKPAGDVDTDRDDDPAEAAYWRFDARRKGYKPYLHVGERDAFKQEYRNALTGKPKDGGDLSGIDLERLSRLNNRKGRLCYQGVDGHYNIGYKNPADRTFVLEVLKSVEKILTADNAKRGE